MGCYWHPSTLGSQGRLEGGITLTAKFQRDNPKMGMKQLVPETPCRARPTQSPSPCYFLLCFSAGFSAPGPSTITCNSERKWRPMWKGSSRLHSKLFRFLLPFYPKTLIFLYLFSHSYKKKASEPLTEAAPSKGMGLLWALQNNC